MRTEDGKEFCRNGHEYTAENLRRDKKGRRSCRICLTEANRRYKQAKSGRIVQPRQEGYGKFDAKFERHGPSECWEWTAARNAKGYGNFQSRSAHVVAYELVNGPVAKGMNIDHLCRNRACVNPAHLEQVTHQENVRRHAATITHCKRGHPLSGDNIEIYPRRDGFRRRCLTCRKLMSAARYKEGAHD